MAAHRPPPTVKGAIFPVPRLIRCRHPLRHVPGAGRDRRPRRSASPRSGDCLDSAKSAPRFSTLVKRADQTQKLKYVVHNVAHQYGKTATFMPNHRRRQRLPACTCIIHLKGGQEPVCGQRYTGLSEMALYYIGGIHQACARLERHHQSGTNSYKRLVPGFEAR